MAVPLARVGLVAATAAALVACSTANAVPQVRARAAHELPCPEADIEVDARLGGRYRAFGCGSEREYRVACDGVTCVVRGEGEPSIPWHDRPEPLSIGARVP